MGAYVSRLPLERLEQLDCRKFFRKGAEGEKLGDDKKEDEKGIDHGDNIPLVSSLFCGPVDRFGAVRSHFAPFRHLRRWGFPATMTARIRAIILMHGRPCLQ